MTEPDTDDLARHLREATGQLSVLVAAWAEHAEAVDAADHRTVSVDELLAGGERLDELTARVTAAADRQGLASGKASALLRQHAEQLAREHPPADLADLLAALREAGTAAYLTAVRVHGRADLGERATPSEGPGGPSAT